MSKLILILLSFACLPSFASGKSKLPEKVGGFDIVYYDYREEEKFKFSKLSKAAFEELQTYLLMEIDEIKASLDDPQSQLRNVMTVQKMNTFLIKILVETSAEATSGTCPPYIDDDDLDSCASVTVLHLYGDKFCISKRDEYSAMALQEVTESHCDLNKNEKAKKKLKPLFSIPARLLFKQLDVTN